MAQRGRKPIDHTGQRFYRLLVLSPATKQKSGATMWLCRCDCGRETVVRGSNLRDGNTKSCGMCARYYEKRQPTEQEEVTRALTFGAQRRLIIDRLEALDNRGEQIRVAIYPYLMGNESVVTAITHLRAFLETAYRDFLWDEFERSARNCDRADACIRQLENLMGELDDRHERIPPGSHGSNQMSETA